MGIAALVLGIISFVLAVTFVLAPLGVILAVIGLILGIVDTVKKGKTGEKKAISMAGMILSAVMFVTLMVESFFILIVGIAVYDTATNFDTDTAIDMMESQAIESFNSKFSNYEGIKKGSSVRLLLSTISMNNNYSEHYVSTYYKGNIEDEDVISTQIEVSQNYKVVLSKGIDGYINRVYILPSYSDTTIT